MIRPLVRALRPAQWIKNLFVFTAPFFARRLLEADVFGAALAAFGAFCAVASGVYLVNDVADRERDRLHPEKRRRPIAAGELRPGAALLFALLLFAAGVGGGFLVAPALGGLLLLYAAIQVGYSTFLRRVVLLDVFCIASGFVIRVIAGAAAVSVYLSSWLILTTIFVSLFLALCKRRAEFVRLAEEGPGHGGAHRETLLEYDPAILDQLISVTTASVVLCYSLYTLSERTIEEFGTRNLVFTVPFVIYGVFRYLFLVHRRAGGASPVKAILFDAPLQVNALLWAAATGAILYSS